MAQRPAIKKHLNFDALMEVLRTSFSKIPDKRQQKKVKYPLVDCLMSAFAMMYFQDPSILEFQRRWEEEEQISNLRSMFGIEKTPCDNQLRNALDQIPSKYLIAPLSDFFERMRRGKQLEAFKFIYDKYLIPIDATGYFGSDKIQCPGCLNLKKSKGRSHYYHLILQSCIVHPDQKHILPLLPEAVTNTEEHTTQDCELNAAKRFLKIFRQKHPKIQAIINGDGLYAHAPFIEECRKNDFSFILTAKPDDHKFLLKKIQQRVTLDQVKQLEIIDEKNNIHTYRWTNDIQLNKSNDIRINYFDYELFNQAKDKVTYKSSWVTDLVVSTDNVQKMVRGARSRWKIENEGFNTLKNHGYELKHNYGHGKQNLSINFFILNLLAFAVHEILALTCRLYGSARQKFSARKEFWNQIRCTFRILYFEDWSAMLNKLARKTGHPRAP